MRMWAWMAVLCMWTALGEVGVEAAHKLLLRRDLLRPGRIVGGEPVKRGALPWQVSLQYEGRHFCGGTLVSDTLVLTAAHCAKAFSNYKRIKVVTGAWDLREDNRQYDVAKVVIADYDLSTYERDIALFRLDVESSDATAREGQDGVPVAIETRQDEWNGQDCTISGWGKVDEHLGLPNLLMAADVKLKSYTECKDIINLNTIYKVYPSNLCAGGGEKDACQGDSGGPLVCCKNSTEDVSSCSLVGVTSWGIGCATMGIPGVYADVAHLWQWIQKVVLTEFGQDELQGLSFISTPPLDSRN